MVWGVCLFVCCVFAVCLFVEFSGFVCYFCRCFSHLLSATYIFVTSFVFTRSESFFVASFFIASFFVAS